MFDYKKTGVDETVLRLLKKLEPDFPFQSVLLEIENDFVSVFKVCIDDKVYGIILARMVKLHTKEFCLCIDHAIAEDDLHESFTNILGESIFQWAKNNGADIISQSAHKKGLCRLLERFYDEPAIYIYRKRLDAWEKAIANQQQVPQQQTKTTV